MSILSCDYKNSSLSEQRQLSLEEEYSERVFSNFNVSGDFKFKDFLISNELCPHNVSEHISLAYRDIRQKGVKRAISVTTGTERSLFHLLFVDHDLCEGLVVFDINGRVKAYLDFAIMLLRICENRDEFNVFSEQICSDSSDFEEKIAQRISKIEEKIDSTDLPKMAKDYYLENLEAFASVYLSISNAWKDEEFADFFAQVRYDKSDELFAHLKRYATAGNIAVMIGDIGNIRLLSTRTIAAIDISNIATDYTAVQFNGEEGSLPSRVIWTSLEPQKNGNYFTQFHSYVHIHLTKEQRSDFDYYLTNLDHMINKVFKDVHDFFYYLMNRENNVDYNEANSIDYTNDPCVSYSVEMLQLMEGYIVQKCVNVPRFGFINFYSPGIEVLNQLSPEELIELCHNEDTSDFIAPLIDGWGCLHPTTYLALSQNIPKWGKKFIKKAERGEIDLRSLMQKLEEAQLFESFLSSIGITVEAYLLLA